MINYAGVIICILFFIAGLIFEKKFLNPISIFCGLWTVILILSSLKLYNLKSTNDSTYFMILIGIISFLLGYYIIKIKKYYNIKIFKIKKKSNKYTNVKIDYIPRYRLIYVLGGLCIFFYLLDLFTLLPYLLRGNSLAYIRMLAQDSNSFIYNNRSVIENAIRLIFITPLSIAIPPVVAVDFWIGKRDKKLLFICFFMLFLRSITDGSRILIVYFMLHFSVAFLFSNQSLLYKKKKNKKKKFTFIIIGIAIGIALYKTTLSRSGSNTLRHLYYYFSMEPYMFEVWANIVDKQEILGYGLASTNGFSFVILYIVKNILGMSKFPDYWYEIYSIIEATDSHWQIIAGEATIANAYVSIFWFLYLDGRIAGIIIGMAIYGMIISNLYFSAINNPNSRNTCIYSLILQGICFSFVRMQFANVYYAISVVLVSLCLYKPIKLHLNN